MLKILSVAVRFTQYRPINKEKVNFKQNKWKI